VLAAAAESSRLFIDVGANVGQWSERMLLSGGAKGVAYEPGTQVFAALAGRFSDNGRMKLRNVAVGDRVGEVVFIEKDQCGETSAIQGACCDQDVGQQRTVRMTTIDADFGDDHEIIDLLKIDAEGYDLPVLKGATRLLSEGRIRFVQFEYGPSWVGVGASLLVAQRHLSQHGYSLYLIRSTGLHPFLYERWGEFYRYSNFFACRDANVAPLARLIKEPI